MQFGQQSCIVFQLFVYLVLMLFMTAIFLHKEYRPRGEGTLWGSFLRGPNAYYENFLKLEENHEDSKRLG